MEPAYPEPRPKLPLSATNPIVPPKPPAPTTLAGKFRAKLPSRGWMIFWGTVGTIGGLITRDHYLTVDAKKRVADKVDILAKQSCGVQDMPRKVTVYLTAPPGDGIHKTRHYFKQFVKPVFDAAALDYEVREGLAAGQIQAMVAADVRKKRQIAAGKATALTEEEQAAPVISLKSVSDGIVVLGRIALGEVLQGYNDGCLQSLEDPEPIVVVQELTEEKRQEQEQQEIKDTTTEESSSTASTSASSSESSSESSESSSEASTETTPAPAPEAAKTEKAVETKPEPVPIPQDEAFFSVPPTGLEPIGYIPFKNLIGFRNFHKKMFALFNSYDCVEYAGNSVMKIAFAETKDMDKEDLDMGRDEEPLFAKYRGPVEVSILDRVQEQVKFFITPTQIPEPKVAVAAEGDELHQ